jgi:hypothetical protein
MSLFITCNLLVGKSKASRNGGFSVGRRNLDCVQWPLSMWLTGGAAHIYMRDGQCLMYMHAAENSDFLSCNVVIVNCLFRNAVILPAFV